MNEQQKENETAGGQSELSGLVMRYREGYHNEWPTVMCGDEPVGDIVGELNALANRLRNAEWQIKFMREEIAKTLELPVQTPADTVESVRQLKKFADARC